MKNKGGAKPTADRQSVGKWGVSKAVRLAGRRAGTRSSPPQAGFLSQEMRVSCLALSGGKAADQTAKPVTMVVKLFL